MYRKSLSVKYQEICTGSQATKPESAAACCYATELEKQQIIGFPRALRSNPFLTFGPQKYEITAAFGPMAPSKRINKYFNFSFPTKRN